MIKKEIYLIMFIKILKFIVDIAILKMYRK